MMRKQFSITICGLTICGLLCMTGCQQFAPVSTNIDPDKLVSPAKARRTSMAATRQKSAGQAIDPVLAEVDRLQAEGKTAEAIAACEKLVEQNKATSTVYHRLAVLHDRIGQFDQSSKNFLAALKLAPQNAEIHCDYGYSRFVQGDLGVAQQTLRRAVKLDPKLARAHNNLGLVLARLGQQDEALSEFKKAGCTKEQAKMNLAFSFISHGQWESAQEQLTTQKRDVEIATKPSNTSPLR